MIMAGRGRRLGDLGDPSKKVGVSTSLVVENPVVDTKTVMKSIGELNLKNVEISQLKTIETSIKKLCATKKAAADVLSALYTEALNSDGNLSEKLGLVLTYVSKIEVDGTTLRKEFLNIMQNEFKSKEEMMQTNKKRLFNALSIVTISYISLLVNGDPIQVLGLATIEYLELLMAGGEDEFKALTKNLVLSHKNLSKDAKLLTKYSTLLENLRDLLLRPATGILCKVWIMLAIEYTSNNSNSLSVHARNYYIKNLGDSFTEIESQIKDIQKHSKKSEKSPGKQTETPDICDQFTDMNLTPPSHEGKRRTNKTPPDHVRHRKKDASNWQGGGNDRKFNANKNAGNWGFSKSEHDDRFDKDENFYGAQQPRSIKKESNKIPDPNNEVWP